MLRIYRKRWNAVSQRLQRAVLRELGVTARRRDTFAALSGHCQADVVLVLLRINTSEALRAAERLVGRRIERCPPALLLLKSGRPVPTRAALDPDLRRVRYVQPAELRMGALPGTPLHARIDAAARPGVSVRGMMSRGLNRRDIRTAISKGWLELA